MGQRGWQTTGGKKKCARTSPRQAEIEGGREGEREKTERRERGVMRSESEGNKGNSLIQMETWAMKREKNRFKKLDGWRRTNTENTHS